MIDRSANWVAQMSESRRCPKCRKNRPAISFNSALMLKWCSICVDDRVEEWRAPARERAIISRVRTPKERLGRLLSAAKARASQKGVPFNLPSKWLADRLAAGKCEVTGLPFDMVTVGSRPDSFAPSIDRKDSSLGYTEDNCQLVIWLYNAAKSTGSIADIVLMARALSGVLSVEDRAEIAKRQKRQYVKDAFEDYISLVQFEAKLQTDVESCG